MLQRSRPLKEAILPSFNWKKIEDGRLFHHSLSYNNQNNNNRTQDGANKNRSSDYHPDIGGGEMNGNRNKYLVRDVEKAMTALGAVPKVVDNGGKDDGEYDDDDDEPNDNEKQKRKRQTNQDRTDPVENEEL